MESLILALMGGTAGLLVAHGMLAMLGEFELPGGVSIGALEVGLNVRLFSFALLFSVVTGLVFGLVPALQSTSPNLVEALKGTIGRQGVTRATRLRKSLVVVQVALCFVLLVGSGLFLRTLQRGFSVDLGIDPENLTVARFNLQLLRYTPGDALVFADQLKRRVEEFPGVTSASVSTRVPLQDGGAMGRFVEVESYERAPDEEMRVDIIFASPGYFRSLGLPLLRGRTFTHLDVEGVPDVAIVSEAMARRYWPNGDAVGGVLKFGDTRVEVVGVVRETTWIGLADSTTNFVYTPLAQSPRQAASAFLTLAARTTSDPQRFRAQIRAELKALDPDVSPSMLSTMQDLVNQVLMPQRMGAVLLSVFGLLALMLAAVGIAGVVGYVVDRQRRDIGVRIALGATPNQVLALVMCGMIGPVFLGVASGFLVVLQLAGLVEAFLFQVSSSDPVTLLSVGLGLTLVAVLATMVPAREAAYMDPAKALRVE